MRYVFVVGARIVNVSASIVEAHTGLFIPVPASGHTDNVVRVAGNHDFDFAGFTVLQLRVVIEGRFGVRVFGDNLADVEYVFLLFVGGLYAFLGEVIGDNKTGIFHRAFYSGWNGIMAGIAFQIDVIAIAFLLAGNVWHQRLQQAHGRRVFIPVFAVMNCRAQTDGSGS
ncbi:hypothetical protein D3C80_1097710 [compost metagenome]